MAMVKWERKSGRGGAGREWQPLQGPSRAIFNNLFMFTHHKQLRVCWKTLSPRRRRRRRFSRPFLNGCLSWSGAKWFRGMSSLRDRGHFLLLFICFAYTAKVYVTRGPILYKGKYIHICHIKCFNLMECML